MFIKAFELTEEEREQLLLVYNAPLGKPPPRVGKPRDDRDVAQNMARGLADITGLLASFKGEAHAWLRSPDYDTPGTGWRTPTPLSRPRRWRRGAGCG
jgi:hypothetical protein